jgi:hypothetical protein
MQSHTGIEQSMALLDCMVNYGVTVLHFSYVRGTHDIVCQYAYRHISYNIPHTDYHHVVLGNLVNRHYHDMLNLYRLTVEEAYMMDSTLYFFASWEISPHLIQTKFHPQYNAAPVDNQRKLALLPDSKNRSSY